MLVWIRSCSVACLLLLFLTPFSAADDVGPVQQDDAGSGRDAPDDMTEDLTILPDIVYEGMSPGPVVDDEDFYHLVGAAGDRFAGWSDGHLGCYHLYDANGSDLAYACSYEHGFNTGPVRLTLPYTGDYYFRVVHLAPAVYRVAFNLSGSAPEVRTSSALLGGDSQTDAPQRMPMPEGCDTGYRMVPGLVSQIPRFTDGCYHMRTGLNGLDTPNIDVLLVPPVTTYPERDLRTMREAIEMWDAGIHSLAREMDLDWLADGVDFDIFVDDDQLRSDPLWDPEIIVVATNPVGGAGIGIDPLSMIFGVAGPCHGQPNPLLPFEAWLELPGFDSHHDNRSGTYTADCEGGGAVCYAVNGAIDPAPGQIDFFGLFDLVAHEVGHCLTIGHVGDANDHEAETVPYADIMAYTDQSHDKCVSTLDVASFALTMSRFLLDAPLAANDDLNPHGAFHVQHPDDHRYASPTGRAEDCPPPDVAIVPGGDPDAMPKQDDAGSGRDAPAGPGHDAVPIAPDRVYEGYAPPLDTADTYRLTGAAGQTFQGWSHGNLGCYYLHDANATLIAFDCAYTYVPFRNNPLVVELPYTGDYYFRIANISPSLYKLSYSLTGPPPPVGLLDP